MALISVSNNALQNITAVPASVASGALVLLSTQTASASASIEFTSGLDSTYDSYIIKLINIHPSNDLVQFNFNLSTDGGSNYNVVKTTTVFRTYNAEDDSLSRLQYRTTMDLAQSTANQLLADQVSNDNDAGLSGTFQIFNPSSTTYVKHFISNTAHFDDDPGTAYAQNFHVAGYANTTSAINAIRFQFASGNIDDGIIKLYGVK